MPMTLIPTDHETDLFDDVRVTSAEAARLLEVGRGKFELLLRDGSIRPVTHPRSKRLFSLVDVKSLRRQIDRERHEARPSWAS